MTVPYGSTSLHRPPMYVYYILVVTGEPKSDFLSQTSISYIVVAAGKVFKISIFFLRFLENRCIACFACIDMETYSLFVMGKKKLVERDTREYRAIFWWMYPYILEVLTAYELEGWLFYISRKRCCLPSGYPHPPDWHVTWRPCWRSSFARLRWYNEKKERKTFFFRLKIVIKELVCG